MISRDKYTAKKRPTLREHAFYDNKVEVDRLLDDGEDVNEAIIGYALANNENEVNALLLNSNASKDVAIHGYMQGEHQDTAKALLVKSQNENELLKNYQYEKQEIRREKQKSKNIMYTVLVALIGIFIPLISIPLPRWVKLKSKTKDPIQKLVVSRDKYIEVKKKREIFRGEEKKTTDYDKPKKVLISKKDDPQRVYLVDDAQLHRFDIFANNSQDYLDANKEKIQNKIKASKAESKKIMYRLYSKVNARPLPQGKKINGIEKHNELGKKEKEISDMQKAISENEKVIIDMKKTISNMQEIIEKVEKQFNENVNELKKEREEIIKELNLVENLMYQQPNKENNRHCQRSR